MKYVKTVESAYFFIYKLKLSHTLRKEYIMVELRRYLNDEYYEYKSELLPRPYGEIA